MKLGLNAYSFIILMLIAGLAIAAPSDRASAAMCYWDSVTKTNVCLDNPFSTTTTTKPTTTGTTCAPSESYVDCMMRMNGQVGQTQITTTTGTSGTTQTGTTPIPFPLPNLLWCVPQRSRSSQRERGRRERCSRRLCIPRRTVCRHDSPGAGGGPHPASLMITGVPYGTHRIVCIYGSIYGSVTVTIPQSMLLMHYVWVFMQ